MFFKTGYCHSSVASNASETISLALAQGTPCAHNFAHALCMWWFLFWALNFKSTFGLNRSWLIVIAFGTWVMECNQCQLQFIYRMILNKVCMCCLCCLKTMWNYMKDILTCHSISSHWNQQSNWVVIDTRSSTVTWKSAANCRARSWKAP